MTVSTPWFRLNTAPRKRISSRLRFSARYDAVSTTMPLCHRIFKKNWSTNTLGWSMRILVSGLRNPCIVCWIDCTNMWAGLQRLHVWQGATGRCKMAVCLARSADQWNGSPRRRCDHSAMPAERYGGCRFAYRGGRRAAPSYRYGVLSSPASGTILIEDQ